MIEENSKNVTNKFDGAIPKKLLPDSFSSPSSNNSVKVFYENEKKTKYI